MHNNRCQASYPFTFRYTHRDPHEEDNRSILSSYTHSSSTTYRINQLRPKSKIIVSKASTLSQNQIQKEHAKTPNISNTSISLSPTLLNTSIQANRNNNLQPSFTPSLEYQNIKPLFNWDKITLLCGFDTHQLGQHGCLCRQPCKWKAEWTKNQSKNDQKTFKQILTQRPSEKTLQQIQKDLPRTHPECPTFSQNMQFRMMLKNVLMAYSVYDPQIGYVQGVNMIAGVLLYHIKNPQQTFWALVEMMEQQQLRMLYRAGFQHLRRHTQHIVKLIQNKLNDLYQLMQELDIIPDCFLNGWLLSLMSNCIPLELMPLVITPFRKHGWKFIYQLIITYLLFLKERLIITNDQSEFLQFVSARAGRELGIEWKEVIESCERVVL